MSREASPLEKARSAYRPRLPGILAKGIRAIQLKEGAASPPSKDAAAIGERFPGTSGRASVRLAEGSGPPTAKALRVGVVLSGGQAPGGHNVIVGISDAIRALDGGSKLYGFKGGPKGIFTNRYEELSAEKVEPYRNTGGFDMIGSGRDKIETEEQLANCAAACRKLSLDGLVVIGGDDSNTNAAVVAEYFLSHGLSTSVVGVPKTIDGDMKGHGVETSFGFDTATKVYAELIGNICRDSKSAGKYWHFVKLMGRSASHVTLECALRTQPNIALIGEEVEAKKLTLKQIVEDVVRVIRARSEAGRNYGVCLVPEGLIEFIPEIRNLIAELNEVLHKHGEYFATLQTFANKREFVSQNLSKDSSYVFGYLPQRIQEQLLLDRDSHGNVQVSRIDTEQLLIEQAAEAIQQLKVEKNFPGSFSTQHHFLGYEGRCAAPSNFDADYTYALGQVAAVLIANGKTGFMASVARVAEPPSQWSAGGVPLTSLMQIEQRKGKPTPVIAKALVALAGRPFAAFAAARSSWEVEDAYLYPGPIQYFGPEEVSGLVTRTLELEAGR